MKKLSSILLFLALILIMACQNGDPTTMAQADTSTTKVLNLDLDKAEDNLTAFVKARSSLTNNEEAIFYANGKIYGFVEGERDKPLLGFEMYNIARSIQKEDGSYELLTNEVLLYTDLKTGEVLKQFENPYTQETVEVLHVWNSPVNQKFQVEGKYGKWGVNHNKYGTDMICMNADVFLAYPSPLKVADYPKNAQSDLYEAAELFQFFFSEKAMNDPSQNSIDCTISWTRIGPWLPWMNMGQRAGKMVYQGAGYKLMEKDYDKMPKLLTEYVMKTKPEYRHAPTTFSSPNETSWTYFKKMNPK